MVSKRDAPLYRDNFNIFLRFEFELNRFECVNNQFHCECGDGVAEPTLPFMLSIHTTNEIHGSRVEHCVTSFLFLWIGPIHFSYAFRAKIVFDALIPLVWSIAMCCTSVKVLRFFSK